MAEKPAYFFRQSGAIPYRRVGPGIEVLLITSSDGSRWIIPKGIIEPNMSAADSAAKEAVEEAGLVGHVSAQPIGEFTYSKWGGTCHVEVFALEVVQEMESWPESNVRKREWLSLEEACKRISDGNLRALLARIPSHIESGAKDPP